MRTRIRHFRKVRGLTQTELAEALGTTAATVSRLETADMTVSTDWLERLAAALDVDVRELIGGEPGSLVCQAELRRGGRVSSLAVGMPLSPALAEDAREPVAFRIAEDMGTYAAGDMLIADRVQPEETAGLLGRDCIAASIHSAHHFGRLVDMADGRCVIVPPETGAAAITLDEVEWIAPVVTLIRRFPPVSRHRSGK